jgi:hypothetical protein
VPHVGVEALPHQGKPTEKGEITIEPTQMEPTQITEQTAEREVYEPPMLAEIGRFAELTSGRGAEVADASSYMRT